ncbi:hypothetical protein A1D31_14090 [Bradyrhizobium liaoningense]|nr:hypothetical protein A1D31_14090 [Bradyrhizobium liaoningense]
MSKRRPLELPPGAGRAFVEDMEAFFAADTELKRDEIAARQLHRLRQHYTGKLRLMDVKQMFFQMRSELKKTKL